MNFFALSVQIWPPHQFFGSLTSGNKSKFDSGSKTASGKKAPTIDSLPPMCRSKYRTPAFASSTILRTLGEPLAVTASTSMPKRCLKDFSKAALSSGLAGIETTTLPSFFPSSTVLSHSDWFDDFVCAGALRAQSVSARPNKIPQEFRQNCFTSRIIKRLVQKFKEATLNLEPLNFER